MKKVRVRFAPSPTGFLHIGGARTAMFNYLFAKHYGGDFVFRLEDTDLERNIEGGEASILTELNWLGIIPDESPVNPNPKYGAYRQTERLEIYQDYAKKLVEEGLAYECFCTQEEMEEMHKQQEADGKFSFRYDRRCANLTEEEKAALRAEGRKPSIRFKVDHDKDYAWDDIVRGEISVPGKDVSDWVILKSNGVATYNFCVAIDDHLMEISHVFRAEEHISNTPKQLMVYDALGVQPPKFGHMTLIVNEQRKKLSKRDGSIMQFCSQYREQGYLPEAMFNFFALLGWSPGVEQEFFTEEELIKIFDEKRFSKSPTMFDKKKLHWIDNHYIKNSSTDRIKAMCLPFLSEFDIANKDDAWVTKLIELYKPQLNFCAEIKELVEPFFKDFYLSIDDVALLSELNAKPLLEALKVKFEAMSDFSAENIKSEIMELGKELSRKGKELFMPIRIAISCQRSGGDLPTVIELYGKDHAIENIKKTIEML